MAAVLNSHVHFVMSFLHGSKNLRVHDWHRVIHELVAHVHFLNVDLWKKCKPWKTFSSLLLFHFGVCATPALRRRGVAAIHPRSFLAHLPVISSTLRPYYFWTTPCSVVVQMLWLLQSNSSKYLITNANMGKSTRSNTTVAINLVVETIWSCLTYICYEKRSYAHERK